MRSIIRLLLLVALGLSVHGAMRFTNAHAQTKVDYLIIVASDSLVAAVDTLKSWKEQIGYSVGVVTLNRVLATPGSDDAERIWNFLHDRYDADNAALRYVLLVGDIDQIPMRLLYPDPDPVTQGQLAFGSDFYYANLDQPNWDVDGDNRWGEFTQDALDTIPEVAVGRIPVNLVTPVRTICQNIVDFEKDTGSWKRSALLAHGIMDYRGNNVKSDQAVLAERLKTDFFTPLGWAVFTLYEEGGIDPTVHAPDDSLSQLNFENNCGVPSHSVLSCNAHGNTGGYGSFQWSADLDNDGEWDPGPPASENVTNWFSSWTAVAGNPISAITMLTGCLTGAIVGNDTAFASSTLRSRYLIRIPRENTIAETYLRHGAPAVIGASAGADYSGPNWTGPEQRNWNTLSYLFFESLLDQDRKAGDAFNDAELGYARRHGFARGIRDFNLFGDPSLSLKGIQNRPGGPDVLVREGSYHGYAADYDDNGDMFVGVITRPSHQTPGEVRVYKSVDHGVGWYVWCVVASPEAIWSVDVLVSRWQSGEQADDRLHVFYTTPSGRVYDHRVQLADSSSSQSIAVAQNGTGAVQVAATRDPQPMPSDHTIYVAWFYESSGTDHVKLSSSSNNGATWFARLDVADRTMPDVDAGPNGHVYLTMLTDPWVTESNVLLVRSRDHGVTWGPAVNLTAGDGALQHFYPSVGASTDPAFPSVWVAYEFDQQTTQWGIGRDLRYAYTPDGGSSWNKNRILSADLGVDEWMADLRSYRAAPNRWVNVAYNQDAEPNPDYRRNVIWRWASGSLPRNWSHTRIVNDYPSSAPAAFAPRVVYSPGTGPGGGVVYGGPNGSNLFFSAPWLPGAPTPPSSAERNRAGSVSTPRPDPPLHASDVADPPAGLSATLPGAPLRTLASGRTASEPLLLWAESEELPGAFAVSSLEPVAEGGLLAAGAARAEGRNQGVVYHSFDGSQWQKLTDPQESWSIACVIETDPGVFLAGGIAKVDDYWYGVIFRSADFGSHWTPVLEIAGGVVSEILETEGGMLYAATGWHGEIYRSDDGGRSWHPLTDLGHGVLVRDIIQAASGDLLVALDGGEVASRIMRSADGFVWNPVSGLSGVVSAYEIADRGDALFAAVSEGTGGRVYRSDRSASFWEPLPSFPDPEVIAARSVTIGPAGIVIAGVERALGPSFTRVFAMSNEAGPWLEYGGPIDLATAVYCLTSVGETVYAGTGFIYGKVYRCSYTALVDVNERGPGRPRMLLAEPSYPNPFGSQTAIAYYLPGPTRVSLAIYGASGRHVCTVKKNEWERGGWHRILWTGLDDRRQQLPSGVYFFRLVAGSEVRTGKVTLLR